MVQRKLEMIERNPKLDSDEVVYFKKLYLQWIRYLDWDGEE